LGSVERVSTEMAVEEMAVQEMVRLERGGKEES